MMTLEERIEQIDKAYQELWEFEEYDLYDLTPNELLREVEDFAQSYTGVSVISFYEEQEEDMTEEEQDEQIRQINEYYAQYKKDPYEDLNLGSWWVDEMIDNYYDHAREIEETYY